MYRDQKQRKWNESACFMPWTQQEKGLYGTNGKGFLYVQDTSTVERQNGI